MRENLLNLINLLLGRLFIFALIGFLALLWLERANFFVLIRLFFSKSKKKASFSWNMLKFLMRPLGLMLWGYILVQFSFFLVSSMLGLVADAELMQPNSLEVLPANANLGMFLKYQAPYSGIFDVLGLIISGVCLMVSGGSRWMVTLAKLVATVTVFYMLVSIFAYYA